MEATGIEPARPEQTGADADSRAHLAPPQVPTLRLRSGRSNAAVEGAGARARLFKMPERLRAGGIRSRLSLDRAVKSNVDPRERGL